MAGSERPAERLDYDDYVRLIRQVDELVTAFDSHPDEPTRERVLALLTAVDLLHRTALRRMVEGLREHGAGPALEGVARDPVVETLLGLYDLAELDIPEENGQAEEPDMDGVVGFVPRESLAVRPGGRGGA